MREQKLCRVSRSIKFIIFTERWEFIFRRCSLFDPSSLSNEQWRRKVIRWDSTSHSPSYFFSYRTWIDETAKKKKKIVWKFFSIESLTRTHSSHSRRLLGVKWRLHCFSHLSSPSSISRIFSFHTSHNLTKIELKNKKIVDHIFSRYMWK